MKKLLGLLAIAPLSMAACGGSNTEEKPEVETPDTDKPDTDKPEVEEVEKPEGAGEVVVTDENDLRWTTTEDANKIIVTNIVLDSEADEDGYNDLGADIKADIAAIGGNIYNADEIVLVGTLDGIDFYKEFNVDGVKDNSGTTTFTDIDEVILYDFTPEGTWTADALFARALKDAGTHIAPDDVTSNEYHAFATKLVNLPDVNTTMTYTELSDAQTAAGGPLVAYGSDQASNLLGIGASFDVILKEFDDTYFIFENITYDVNEASAEIKMMFHHESRPATHWYATWGLISTA